jgi:predicted SAM-dependent methyltransferase
VRSLYRRLRLRWTTALRGPVGAPALGVPDDLLRRIAGMLRLRAPIKGPRRVEVGSGGFPNPGYVHIDVDADEADIDLMARGPHLPIPNAWATEVLAIHVIEHLPPNALDAAIAEWHRVLTPGGLLSIHTPNADAVFSALAKPDRFWAAQGALFGYARHPRDYSDPRWMGERGDHRVVFTFEMLREVLEQRGFVDIRDDSGVDPCRHAAEWAPFIEDLCLEVTARKS